MWIRLFWIFVMGSFLGFLLESIFSFFELGRIIWCGSLILLPLNTVYGCGAVALSAIAFQSKRKNIMRAFLTGAIMGTLVESAIYKWQSAVFGSASWDYTNYPLSIGKSICLIFTFGWGILAVIWGKTVWPLFKRLINAVPVRVIKPLTIALFALILGNAVMSVLAISRWGTRLYGIPAVNGLMLMLDKFFPNDVMMRYYENMRFYS